MMKYSPKHEFYAASGMAVLTLALLLPTLTLNRLLGLDEAVYAQIAREALEKGHWLPLYWRGEPFYDKPFLVPWLQALGLGAFGFSEFAIRLPAALAAAGCVFFTVRLSSRLSGSLLIGCLAAAWMLAQKHFILFGRTGTLDMALACCLLAAWWRASLAAASGARARRHLLASGLWMALAVLVKSWLGLAFVPALALAFFMDRPGSRLTKRDISLRLILPPLLAQASFLGLYRLAYGPASLKWEASFNLLARLRGGGFVQSVQKAGGAMSNLEAYGSMALEGLATLWPMALAGFLFWTARIFREGEKDARSLMGLLAGLSWLSAMMLMFQQNINYFVVLIPLLACGWAFWAGAGKSRAGWAVFCAAGLLSVSAGAAFPGTAVCLALSLVSGFASVYLDQGPIRRPAPAPVPALLAVLAFTALGMSARYWLRPPDPNAALVLAVKEHPAAFPGEELLLYAHPVEGHVLEFYSDYRTVPITRLPEQPPDKPMLAKLPDGVKFYRKAKDGKIR